MICGVPSLQIVLSRTSHSEAQDASGRSARAKPEARLRAGPPRSTCTELGTLRHKQRMSSDMDEH